MLKKSWYSLFISLFLLYSISKAQVSQYTFSASIGTYTPITTGTVLGNYLYSNLVFGTPGNLAGSTNGGFFPGYPIGFDFNLDGTVYDRFALCSNGWIKLGRSADSIIMCYYGSITSPINIATNQYSNCSHDNIISALGTEIVDGTFPVIRYLVSGVAPNKVLTIQWNKFYCKPYQLGGSNTYSANFQIKLYQANNQIEFIYGTFNPLQLNTNATGKIEIGIKGLLKTNILMCKTDSTWESAYTVDSAYTTMSINNINRPPSGLTYKFTPVNQCIGTPNAGVAVTSLHYVCPTDIDSITLIGNDNGVDISYQWESSTDTINWSPIVGKTARYLVTKLNATSYFRCIVSCDSGSADTSAFVKVIVKDTYLCSTCIGNGGNCILENSKVFYDLKILGTTFHLPDQSGGCNLGNLGSYFTTYDPVDSYTANLFPSIPYYLDFTPQRKAYYLSMWIDYNHNSIFEASEYFPIADTVYPFIVQNVSFIIPSSAYTGYAQVRFKYSYQSLNQIGPNSGCGSGYDNDFIFFIGSQLPCSSPPYPGIAVSTKNNICFNDYPVISLIGSAGGVGVTYQWQISYDSLNWGNINETNPIFITSRLADTVYYHCIVTCNGVSRISQGVGVFGKASYLCYCASNLNGADCVSNDFINNVKILGTNLDNGDTLCNINSTGSNISIFDPLPFTTATLHRGNTYILSVTCNQSNRKISAWLDYNRNGNFSLLEHIPISNNSTAYLPNTASFTVPNTALLGLTGLRIRSNDASGSNLSTDACSHFLYGETEEYYITLDVANQIIETSKSLELQISPNPANELLKLTFILLHPSDVVIELLNSSGKIVVDQVYKNLSATVSKTIDVSKLAKGIYFLQIKHSEGIETNKIIVD